MIIKGPIEYTVKMDQDPLETDTDAIIIRSEGEVALSILPIAYLRAAECSDRSAIRECARLAGDWIRQTLDGPEQPSQIPKQEVLLLEWLSERLAAIAEGEEPNSAFQWKQNRRGRTGPGLSEKLYLQMVAELVRMTATTEGSIDAAVHRISEETNISYDKVWQAYKDYKDD